MEDKTKALQPVQSLNKNEEIAHMKLPNNIHLL